MQISRLIPLCLASLLVLSAPFSVRAEEEELTGLPPSLRERIEEAVDIVRPALVRIHVVNTHYRDGREMKFEASGSGVVISPEGHVITNHHVAGHATQIKCVFADKTEAEAELVGTDPLTDISILKLVNHEDIEFPVVSFGDSSEIRVGDMVLAMGSPLALSQSVTLGIVSNTEMIMPEGTRRFGGLRQDGEDVGALVRWIGHDAAIFPGNSGGPLVNLEGEIIGINEIGMGLGGAIPGNLASAVAEEIIEHGRVRRAWIGVNVQPRLKHDRDGQGILVSGAISGSPADEAGIRSGDYLIKVEDEAVDVLFHEQLPEFNLMVADLPIGEPVAITLLRDDEEVELSITPIEREAYQQKQFELRQWGLTARNLSNMMAQEMKRPNREGVLVTSVRTGGPAGDAKPVINSRDVIVEVAGKPVRDVESLREITEELTKDADEPVPVLTTFERQTDRFVTVVSVGMRELQDPGLEVKNAWLPVETQVITRDIARAMDNDDLRGFRITHVYQGSTADAAGLLVGDLVLAVDDEPMTATALEHYEELEELVRQYRAGDTVELRLLRNGEERKLPVELIRAPNLEREMKRYQDENFEFTVRDVTFFDKAREQWEQEERGVLVDAVISGSWASLGGLSVGDLIQEVNEERIHDVEHMEKVMQRLAEEQPQVVVLKTTRGIYTYFIELEPQWDTA